MARLDRGFASLARSAGPGLFAFAVMDIQRGRVWASDPAARFPLAGLTNLPVAAAALAAVDAGRLSLGERLAIGLEDLSAPPSRINPRVAAGGRPFEAPCADLIALAIRDQDATACDALLSRIGGPAAVTQWLRAKGVTQMSVDRSDRERTCETFGLGAFRPAWSDPSGFRDALDAVPPDARQRAMEAALGDARDTASLAGAVDLLSRLATGDLLAPLSTTFLLRGMGPSPVRPRGLSADLPAGARVSSLRATCPTVLGITPADNEWAILDLTDGRRLAVAAFLGGSTATGQARDDLLAQAGALAARAVSAG
jgi:beta-lactamase class A